MTQVVEQTEVAIKVRKRGAKSWWFLSSGGAMNRLRIHAVRFADKHNAQEQADAIMVNNLDYEAKVVSI